MSYWNYGGRFPNKSPSVKYKGLKNQGATCYLNSVLQVLFMTEDFREAVERYPGTECIDLHLKTLFEKLYNQNADTYDITKQLGVKRVYEQQDAAEYFEKILQRTSDEASQIFHGQLTHRTTCSGCDTQTDADGRIWHLPLTLVDSYNSEYSVVNGIEEYFRAMTFSGENQMYCDHCDAKQDATIKCVMKHHPEVLMLLLKRFELDYYSMTYFKNNCTVRIPCSLQIPENQTYELYAVVEHVGDLRSGHYSATIKSQEDDKWYQFSDTRVTLVDFQPFQTDQSERSDRAYLLFYRKKSVPAADTSTPEVIVEESTPGGRLSSTSDDDNEGQDVIMVNGQEEVQEAADARNDTAVVSFIDQESRVYSRQSITNNHEENDSLHQCQDREEDEGKTVAANEEIVGRSVEDKQAEKTEVISGESRHEESVENHKIDGSKKKRQQGHIRASSYDGMSEQKALTTREGQEHPQQFCVVVQIENEEIEMDIKRDKDRDEQRERRGRGQHQVNKGSDDVGKSLKVDLERRQESGEDISCSEADKKGGEKRVKGERKAASEEKQGADRVESVRRKLSTTRLDNVRVDSSTQDSGQDDQLWKRGSGGRHSGHDKHREEKTEVKRRDDKQLQREPSLAKPREDAEKRSSDDNDQERAHPARKGVYVAEKQEEGEDHERVRDRGRSSYSQAGLERSRSTTECQDTSPDQADKKGGKKRMKEDFKAGLEEKQGADRVESVRRKLSTTRLDNVRVDSSTQDSGQDDQLWKRGSSGRHSGHDKHREEKTAVKRRDDKQLQREPSLAKPRDAEKRSSDDNDQERAHPACKDVYVAEKQEKRGDRERVRDRDRSSYRQAGQERSRSTTECQDTSSDKKGGEKRMKGDFKAGLDEKMGADRAESGGREFTTTTTFDNVRVDSSTQDMAQDDQAGKRGSGSRHGGHEQHEVEKMEVQKAKEQKRRDDKQLQRKPSLTKPREDADKRSSDDIDQERAHPARKDVYAAEKQEKRGDRERVRDRGRSSYRQAGLERSRSTTECQDTSPDQADKKGGKKRMKEDFKAGLEEKQGADRVESVRRKLSTTTLDNVGVDSSTQDSGQDDQLWKRGSSGRHSGHDKHREEKTAVKRRDDKQLQREPSLAKPRDAEKRSSDDNDQERAHPARKGVYVAEKQEKRGDRERVRDRDRSSYRQAGLERSRSTTECQDTSSDKKGGEKRMKGDFKAGLDEKMGADRAESGGREFTTTTFDNVRVDSSTQDMAQDDQAGKRGSGSRHGGHEQHEVEKMEVQKAKEQKRRDDKQLQRKPSLTKPREDADKRSSDDIDQERAHPARKDVYVAEKQEEEGGVGKIQFDEEKQCSKKAGTCRVRKYEEETRETPSGIQKRFKMTDLTLETAQEASLNRGQSSEENGGKRKAKFFSKRRFHNLIHGKRGTKRVSEKVQEGEKEKHSKDKKKRHKNISCFTLKRQTSESD